MIGALIDVVICGGENEFSFRVCVREILGEDQDLAMIFMISRKSAGAGIGLGVTQQRIHDYGD